MTLRASLGGLGMVLAAASAASAASVYQYVTDQQQYVFTGSPVTITVSLQETNTNSPSQLVAQNGLTGFDVSLSRVSGTGLISDAADTSPFQSVLLVYYSPAKPIALPGVAAEDFAVSALDDPGPTGTLISSSGNDSVRELLLGTFTINGPGEFQVCDSALGSNTVTNAGGILDPSIGSATFTISSVPEPTSLALLGLGGLLALRRRAVRE